MRPDPHSRNLRLHRLTDTPAIVFITKSLLPKKPILDEAAREIIVSAFVFSVQQHRIYLRAFVVMPDHWHALFALREPWVLPKFMQAPDELCGWQDDYTFEESQYNVARRVLRHACENLQAV